MSENNNFQCPERDCGRSFRSAQGLQQHLNTAQHGLACRQCSQRFAAMSSLRDHEQKVHSSSNNNSNNNSNDTPLAIPASRSSRNNNHNQGGGRRLGTSNDNNNDDDDHHHNRSHHHKHQGNNNNNNRGGRNNNNRYNNNDNDENDHQDQDRYYHRGGRGGGGGRGGRGGGYHDRSDRNHHGGGGGGRGGRGGGYHDPFANRDASSGGSGWGGFGGRQQQQQGEREPNSFKGSNNNNTPFDSSSALLTLQQQLLQGGGGENTGAQNGVTRQSKNFYDKIVHQFATSKETEVTFPPTLTPAQRQQVHRLAANYGLQHKSHGEGANRCIKLSKTSAAKEFYTNVQPLNDRNLMTTGTTTTSANNTSDKNGGDDDDADDSAATTPLGRISKLVTPEFDKMNTIISRLQNDTKFRQEVENKSLGGRKAQIISHHTKRAPPPVSNNNNTNNRHHHHNNSKNKNDGDNNNDSHVMTPMEARKHLPVYRHRQEIITAVQKNDVVLISATTGAGKTTGVPAYLLESGIFPKDSFILCTQPRRISAISVASRVAQERDEPLGASVGYTVRFDSETSSATRLVYMTTGILLRRLHSDPSLQDVAAVIVDEVHERDMNTDFVLMLLKDLIKINNSTNSKRKFPLKLIVMSATMQTEKLLEYLQNQQQQSRHIPHISIAGTLHPVRSHFLEDIHRMLQMPQPTEQDIIRQFGAAIASVAHQHGSGGGGGKHHHHHGGRNNNNNDGVAFDSFAENATMMSGDRELESFVPYNLICNLVRSIHLREKDRNNNNNNGSKGAILIFLPGWGAIDKLMKMLREVLAQLVRELSILPLHSSLSLSEQRLVFDPPPRGFRKIILATNIAETSITVEDVAFVIDSCLHKSTHYDSAGNTTALQCQLVSQSNCIQRRGRAGRVRAGDCYHLLPKKIFDQLPKYLAPEMLRSSLLDVCLQSKAIMPSKKVIDFLATAMDPPPEKSIEHAVAHLKQLGAFNGKEILTGLGRALAHMPIDCVLGKMLLLGACTGVLDAMTIITASLGAKSPFVRPPPHLAKEAAAARARCAGTSASDHIATLNLYRKWKAAPRPAHVAQEFWADHLVLNNIDRTVKQLKQAVLDSGFVKLPSSLLMNEEEECGDDQDHQHDENNNNNRRGSRRHHHHNKNNYNNDRRGKLEDRLSLLDSIASKYGDNTSLIQLCLSMALYPNFASKELPIKKRRNQQWICWDEKHTQVSPNSVVSSCSNADLYGREFIVFFDRMRIETQVVLFDGTALPRSLMILGCRYLDKLDEVEAQTECKEVAEQNPDCLYLPLEKDFISRSSSNNNNNNNKNNNNEDDDDENEQQDDSLTPTLPKDFAALVVDEGMKRWGAHKKAVDVLWKLHCALHFFFSFSCQQMKATEFPTDALAQAISIIGGTPASVSTAKTQHQQGNADLQKHEVVMNRNPNEVRVLSVHADDAKKESDKNSDSETDTDGSASSSSDGDEVLPMIVATNTNENGSLPTFKTIPNSTAIQASQVEALSAMFGDLSMFKL